MIVFLRLLASKGNTRRMATSATTRVAGYREAVEMQVQCVALWKNYSNNCDRLDYLLDQELIHEVIRIRFNERRVHIILAVSYVEDVPSGAADFNDAYNWER